VEICGFLVQRSSIQTFRRLPNAGGAGEFWIDQSDMDAVLADLERHGMEVTGFVHSHGSGLRSSASDEAGLRSSRWPWLIVVCRESEVQGQWFWIEAGEIRSEPMKRRAG
jgi:proteasome lid subunit RPN8/RPN11